MTPAILSLCLAILGVWASSPAADFHEMAGRPGCFAGWMAAGFALLVGSASVVALASRKLELTPRRTAMLVIGTLVAALTAESIAVLALLDGDTFKYVYFRQQYGVAASGCFALVAACLLKARTAVRRNTFPQHRRGTLDVLEVLGWLGVCICLVYALAVLRRSSVPDGLFRVARIGESVFIYGASITIVTVYFFDRIRAFWRKFAS